MVSEAANVLPDKRLSVELHWSIHSGEEFTEGRRVLGSLRNTRIYGKTRHKRKLR